ncbi:hypothetical protein CLV91_1800 [Maribacter vaceletii]|uniref:Uncharacterized protein n=1 Tax=Maribacter vaceletii TaxID=1206816 RepID=A0A495E8F6_9FLAO|nr:hypothetical protein CLV91_1800 [Maribacter vaceletii]
MRNKYDLTYRERKTIANLENGDLIEPEIQEWEKHLFL